MFSIGFFELVIIFLVGCLVIDPKRIPSIVRDIRIYYKKIMKIRSEISDIIRDINLDDEEDDKNLEKKTTKLLIGDDGSFHEAYDVNEIISKNKKDISKNKKDIILNNEQKENNQLLDNDGSGSK